jgi:hypothetical protein
MNLLVVAVGFYLESFYMEKVKARSVCYPQRSQRDQMFIERDSYIYISLRRSEKFFWQHEL